MIFNIFPILISLISTTTTTEPSTECNEILENSLKSWTENQSKIHYFTSKHDIIQFALEKEGGGQLTEKKGGGQLTEKKGGGQLTEKKGGGQLTEPLAAISSIPEGLLRCASAPDHHLASIKQVADAYFYGLFGVPIDAVKALDYYHLYVDLAAEQEPNQSTLELASVYSRIGTMYATGLGSSHRDYPRALVYHSLAVLENDPLAHHTLGYYHYYGIGVEKDCKTALWHYTKAAESCVDSWKAVDLLGGRKLSKSQVSLDEAGLFGKGASGNGNPNLNKDAIQLGDSDLLLLYKVQAEGGDAPSQLMLGQTYYYGHHGVAIDYPKALQYLKMAAKQYPNYPKPKDVSENSFKQLKFASSSACGMIGFMYARGEGVEIDYGLAQEWFERGISQENGVSFTWLGKMYLEGRGNVERSYARGLKLLNEAVALGDADGKAFLAEELMKMQDKDWTRIQTLLEASSRKGNVYSTYLLARLLGDGTPDIPGDCYSALVKMKSFVERARFHDEAPKLAQQSLAAKQKSSALVYYIDAAERGYHVSQMNAAMLLDIGGVNISGMYLPGNTNPFSHSLPLYVRAANQGNIDARVRVGDLYYYGFTQQSQNDQVEKRPKSKKTLSSLVGNFLRNLPLEIGTLMTGYQTSPNYTMALAHYSAAAEGDYSRSSMAMFNLGFMYEYGLGVDQDFHLAKRYYDLAVTTNPGCFLPVQIVTHILFVKWMVCEVLGYLGMECGIKTSAAINHMSLLPGETVQDESNEEWQILWGLIDLEMVGVFVLCFLLGVLLYYRQIALERLDNPAPQPAIIG